MTLPAVVRDCYYEQRLLILGRETGEAREAKKDPDSFRRIPPYGQSDYADRGRRTEAKTSHDVKKRNKVIP